MSVGYSTNLQLVEPVTGTESGNWGYDINYGTTDYIDISIAGTNTITTDADVTLTQTTGSTSGNNITGTTAQYYILNCTGARTANRNIIAPAISKTYYVINATTTATTPFTITIKKSGGTGVTIPPGAAALVAYNGTDFQAINLITGTLGFADTNIVSSAQASVNTYVQEIVQNTNSGTSASADFIVANNLSTATTYYGDFGINSSTFSGTGSLSAANATYITATSGDLAIGTTTSNSIHMVINGSATDAMTINTSGAIAVNGSYGTTGQVLTTGGSSAVPTWTTPVSLSTANTWTATQTFNGSSSTEAMKILNIAEPANVVGSAPSSTTNFYVNSGAVQLYTTNAANNWTINFAFSSGTTLNTAMSVGDSISCTMLATQGSTAYYNSAITIDGTSSGVTVYWQGGTAPTKGNASGIDSYSYVILKTASATYTVLATQTQF